MDKLNEISDCIQTLQKQITEFISANPDFDLIQFKQKTDLEGSAKLYLQFAYVLNSIFYCLCRVQGKTLKLSPENNEINGFSEGLSVMDQLQKVKSYFIKVDREFHPEKYEKKREQKHQMIDPPKKPVEKIIERAVKSNENQETKKSKKATKGGRQAKDFMSSSDGSEAEDTPKVDSLLKKRKKTHDDKSAPNKLLDRMHGATVVPEPAFLKFQKYVKK